MHLTLTQLKLATAVTCSAAALLIAFDVLDARLRTSALAAAALPPGPHTSASALPAPWIDDLLAVQDPGFHGHRGVDLRTPGAGITTLTQGLAKQLYFDDFEPGVAKIRQTLLARFALDPSLDKAEQLDLFLNIAWLGTHDGETVRGFPAAARAYFDAELQALSRSQWRSVVAMLIAPRTFHVLDEPERNARRAARIAALCEGRYQPKGLMDLYYGELTPEEAAAIPTASYFP